jgi:hypothetical protein
MKVWVYTFNNEVFIYDKPYRGTVDGEHYMELSGTLDLDIQKEKKWVKKESEITSWGAEVDNEKLVSATWVPLNARNVKVTYEVEE